MQWLAQVMARRCEEAGLGQVGQLELVCALLDPALERCIGSLQLRGHAVELLAQHLEFVARSDGNALAQIAGANSRRAFLERFDRTDHPPGKHEPREHGESKRSSEQGARTQN